MGSRRTAEPQAPSPPFVCHAAALRGASRRVSQLYDDALAPTGLRGTQFSVLARVDRLGTPSVNDLAQALAMDRSTLGHNLRPLERDGYVRMSADPDDRRARVISLTALGRRKLAMARPLWAQAHARFEHAFGCDRAGRLRALLVELASDEFAEAFASG